MARGTVKWFNPTKGYGFIQPSAAAVARTFSSTFQLLSGPASAHSMRDKPSNSKSRAIAERNPRSTSR